jgi:large subunit ribosomal protein L9
MQVILKNDVDHLGYSGDVVDVKKGYWRNYLRPRNLAEAATGSRIAEMTARMERRRAAEARNEDEAKELQALLNRTVLTIPAHAGPQGKLFGSVTAFDISRAVESARKLRIDAKRIQLAEPIKALGTFMVPVEVFAGVTAEMKTMVVQSSATEDELARMAADAKAAEEALVARIEAEEAAKEAAEAKAAEAPADGDADAAEAPAADEAPEAVADEAPEA